MYWLDRHLMAVLLRDGLGAALAADTAQPALDLPGLSISAEAVFALLSPPNAIMERDRLQADADQAWSHVLTLPAGVFARLSGFGLDDIALQVLALCLAPDLDGRYVRVFGFLHDDLTCRRATRVLLRRVLGSDTEGDPVGSALAATAPLRRLGIVHAAEAEAASALATWQAAPAVLCALERDVPAELAPFIRLSPWADPETTQDEADAGREAAAATLRMPRDGPLLLHVSGHRTQDRRAWAEKLLHLLRATPLRIELPPVPPDVRSAGMQGQQLALMALLTQSLPVIDLPASWQAPEAQDAVASLVGAVALQGLILALVDGEWVPPMPMGRIRQHIRLDVLSPAARGRIWHRTLAQNGVELEAAELATLGALRLEASEIAQAVTDAKATTPFGGRLDVAALLTAARRMNEAATPRFARRIPPTIGLERIVLPPDRHAQLREIVAQIRHAATVHDRWGFRDALLYGRGVTALFAGPSGTGKTLSARAIAGELGIDLLQIDLAQVVSKYIGETEKNLSTVFAAAESSGVALLFDEADALFGKRSEVKDAHDRYANIETAFLLQRLEEYSGLAILTTNLRPNLDPAFLRRLRFVVDFPRPDAALRAALWEQAFPPLAPLDADLDLELLAERLDLTGGAIQGAALRAAYLAAAEACPIGMRHIVYACRRELLKVGQLSAERDLAALALTIAGHVP